MPCFALAILTGATSAASAAGSVGLQQQPPIGKDIDAFPRLVSGAAPSVVKKINQSLAAADAWARSEQERCHRDSGGAIERSVSVSSQGPRYLSLVAADNYFCGNAFNQRVPLVFDLTNGLAPDWRILLPGLALQASPSGSPLYSIAVTWKSQKLSQIYRAAAIADRSGPDAECDTRLNEGSLAFVLWPDAGEGNVQIEAFGPSFHDACVPDLALTRDQLSAAGASAAFLKAIAKPR